MARTAGDCLETHEYLDHHCRFFLILESLARPDMTPHETMRQGRAVFQYEPLMASDINGD